jgi:hypothetical protein
VLQPIPESANEEAVHLLPEWRLRRRRKPIEKNNLMEGESAARPQDGRRRPDHVRGVGLMHQNVAAERQIERLRVAKILQCRDLEPKMSACYVALSRGLYRDLVTIDPDNTSFLADDVSHHRADISRSTTYVQHAHPGTKARFVQKTSRDGCEDSGLELEARNLFIRVTHQVLGIYTSIRSMNIHWLIPSFAMPV